MEVFSDTKIYIFCPNGGLSGGPDALHQLCYYFNRQGYCARMVYFFSENTKCPQRFEKYSTKAITYQEVEDKKSNIIIVPEANTAVLKKYRNIRKCIWWLSYGFYDGLNVKLSARLKVAFKNFIKSILNIFKTKNKYVCMPAFPVRITDKIYNFCGSRYTYEKLVEKKYKNVEMLVEPLSLEFINSGMATNLSAQERKDVVAYNPAKPSNIMTKLLTRSDIHFVPIKNMTLSEIIALFRSIKLYIDFGEFGGPERLPKESVYNGTCLLVGKRNAAVNDFDVAIPDCYKIEDINDESLIAEKIKDLLAHYDEHIGAFEPFRLKIDKLEENFIQMIIRLFVKV